MFGALKIEKLCTALKKSLFCKAITKTFFFLKCKVHQKINIAIHYYIMLFLKGGLLAVKNYLIIGYG
jgi:hypothetical protein